VVLFTGNQTREEIIEAISRDRNAFDNIIAMANVGAAFSQISILEDLVVGLILTSKAMLQQKLSEKALDESSLFMARYRNVRSSTLGRLIEAVEKSGIEGRDIRYLRRIVARNPAFGPDD
jgi:hypothetical protein